MALKNFKVIQLMSNSYQASPWRADTGCAWWLLCQPSPKVRSATHQLLRESSRVAKRRRAPIWVAEFTSQVVCSPKTTRKQMPHKNSDQPPIARSAAAKTTKGTQKYLL